MTVDIRASGPVRAVLGADGLAPVLAVASLASARCPICGQTLPPAGPAVVLVARSTTATQVTYAHETCAPARHVVDVADDALAAAWPRTLDMRMVAGLLEHDRAVLPTLITELAGSRPYTTTGPAGEVTDLLLATLLQQGFALVSRVKAAPRKVSGWQATIGTPAPDGTVQLDVAASAGFTLYTGQTILPGGWADAARSYGWCVVYCTQLAYPTHGSDAQEGVRALRAAASAGGLVGARVEIRW